MGMDNKFVVLDKSRDKVEALQKFIEEVKDSIENRKSEYRLSTYDFNIKQYGDFWGLEGEFRNTCLSDLEHWLVVKERKDIVADSMMVIHYENGDFASLYNILGNGYGEALFDVYDNALCEDGYTYEDSLPMKELREYFCSYMEE